MPDFITEKIASDMRTVAAKLEEFSKMYDHGYPTEKQWSADDLRREADAITAS